MAENDGYKKGLNTVQETEGAEGAKAPQNSEESLPEKAKETAQKVKKTVKVAKVATTATVILLKILPVIFIIIVIIEIIATIFGASMSEEGEVQYEAMQDIIPDYIASWENTSLYERNLSIAATNGYITSDGKYYLPYEDGSVGHRNFCYGVTTFVSSGNQDTDPEFGEGYYNNVEAFKEYGQDVRTFTSSTQLPVDIGDKVFRHIVHEGVDDLQNKFMKLDLEPNELAALADINYRYGAFYSDKNVENFKRVYDTYKTTLDETILINMVLYIDKNGEEITVKPFANRSVYENESADWDERRASSRLILFVDGRYFAGTGDELFPASTAVTGQIINNIDAEDAITAESETILPVNNITIEEGTGEAKNGTLNLSIDGTGRIRLPENSDEFNKYCFSYTASENIIATITYDKDGKTYQEEFYLEKTEDEEQTPFESFIDGYISSTTNAKNAQTIQFKSVNNGNASIKIKNTKIAKYQKILEDPKSLDPTGSYPNKVAVYAENDSIKMGISLRWGGTLSYLENKENNEHGNLIDDTDWGRLVQQSWFSFPSASSYEYGYAVGDVAHGYRPTQGGDQGKNASSSAEYGRKDEILETNEAGSFISQSKLVDVKKITGSGGKTEGYYVKCIPKDWPKAGAGTQAYMESLYTINQNYVEVTYRYMDFSGLNSEQYATQETPAFFVNKDLKFFNVFFHDGNYEQNTRTPPDYFNSENLEIQDVGNYISGSFWSTGDTDLGIGVFTPGATKMGMGWFWRK